MSISTRRPVELNDELMPDESTLFATIIGQTPFLMHKPNLAQASDEVTSTKKQVPLPADEAEAAAYRNANGSLILPFTNLRRSVLEAGRKLKDKESGPRANAFKVLSAAIGSPAVEGFELIHPDTGAVIEEYEIDSRRVTIGKAAVMRNRPRFDAWAVKAVLPFDSSLVAAELVANALMIAGSRIGVGDFRPEKGGGSFGKFTVADIEVED